MSATQFHDPLSALRARKPGFLQRLRGRIKNGLIVQDLLDSFGHVGLMIHPYFVNAEFGPREAPPPLPEQCSVRRLGVADAGEIMRVTLRPPDPAELSSNLEQHYCVGLFYEGELAAYSWASSTRGVPVPDAGDARLFDVSAEEAYVYDMYVVPRHRGSRLAITLAQAMHTQLALLGRHHYYSFTIGFNRSARRFKTRLGAREMELRLYLHLRWGRLQGVDFRLRRWGERLRTPTFMTVNAISK